MATETLVLPGIAIFSVRPAASGFPRGFSAPSVTASPAKPTTMFRPSASSTYSSAMSAMRTQALPKYCRIRGSTSRAAPMSRY
mgnify:CR=1 FL=1